MKLVKNKKVVKLRPVRIDINYLIKKTKEDSYMFEHLLVAARGKDGSFYFGYSKGMTKDQHLRLALETYKYTEGKVLTGE